MNAGKPDPPAPPAAPAQPAEPVGAIGLGPPVFAGFAIVALFFGGFGVWAAMAPLESAAIAPAVIIVESRRKTVQHLEGGIIRDIVVSEGATVEAGAPLIVLDDTQANAMLELLGGRLRAASARVARLLAERDGAPAIAFPGSLAAAAGASADVAAILEGQRRIFAAQAGSIDSQTAILRQRIAQYSEEIAGLEAEIVAQDSQLALIEREIDGVGQLVEKGLERKPRLFALQRRMAEIEGSRARNSALIARVRQNIGEAELRIVDLGTMRLNDVVQELRDAEAEVFDLRERVGAAEDILNRTIIVAPASGTVVNLQVFTSGGVIAPGESLMEIVPSDDELVIEARIDPNDIDVVHPGLAAHIRLTAFPLRTTPTLEGRVTTVSADRLVDARSGQAYYSARVVFAEGQDEILSSLELSPGMPAQVMIATGTATALDYMLRPIISSFERALREN